MRENPTIFKQKLRSMASGMPSKHIGSTCIIGVKNLWVEINVIYIKGMLNSRDIQPGAVVNRWIIGIKLPVQVHTGLDGLSWCTTSPNDPVEEDDADDWLNKTRSFAIILMNSHWACRLN